MRTINKLYWYEQLGDWATILKPILTDSKYITKLFNFIKNEQNRTKLSPQFEDIFRAFRECQFKDTKIVIFGIQPSPFYDNDDKKPLSNGLAYGNHTKMFNKFTSEISVITDCVERNEYNGLKFDTDYELITWAQQGVLLLNLSLTGVPNKRGAHLKPWEKFIRYTIKVINEQLPGTIWCLWGEELKPLKDLINKKQHYILINELNPRDAVKQGIDWQCEHFDKINNILIDNNNTKIIW